jgi:hypothetical protein
MDGSWRRQPWQPGCCRHPLERRPDRTALASRHPGRRVLSAVLEPLPKAALAPMLRQARAEAFWSFRGRTPCTLLVYPRHRAVVVAGGGALACNCQGPADLSPSADGARLRCGTGIDAWQSAVKVTATNLPGITLEAVAMPMAPNLDCIVALWPPPTVGACVEAQALATIFRSSGQCAVPSAPTARDARRCVCGLALVWSVQRWVRK